MNPHTLGLVSAVHLWGSLRSACRRQGTSRYIKEGTPQNSVNTSPNIQCKHTGVKTMLTLALWQMHWCAAASFAASAPDIFAEPFSSFWPCSPSALDGSEWSLASFETRPFVDILLARFQAISSRASTKACYILPHPTMPLLCKECSIVWSHMLMV